MTSDALLDRLEGFYDAVLRTQAVVLPQGPFTLFVTSSGRGGYARPTPGSAVFSEHDVSALLERQHLLGVPRAIEWVHETSPALLAVARAVGLLVEECPLLVLDGSPHARSLEASGVEIRAVAADDPDLVAVRSAVSVGFAHGGTLVGTAGVDERDARMPARDAGADGAAIASGRSVLLGAFDRRDGAVGGGSHSPVSGVSEVVGVAVLPSYRRRGIAAALTATLARHALDHGADTVFCSAQDTDVARVYEGVGFRRVGTACVAEAPTDG